MLILAGVAISALTGNGILGKEKEMRFKAKMSQIAEEWDVKRISNKLDMYSDEKNTSNRENICRRSTKRHDIRRRNRTRRVKSTRHKKPY